ncbi:MlaD family protein [Chryseobacterium gotjawalense]|uniref:MlaD family protein n=1 Tax=Chryseobacterium gotjawalense TaxID=3042315 RepID=A0ABY8R9D3_9FLAO|nr:MlaD family protein [Chryseobacterium sp. wdc7]WHF50446.1 MlaD family protein [Chryseobacterium sp. wdc7]
MGKSGEKVKVGIFVVVGTVLLIAALYFIGQQQQMFSRTIKLYAVFNNVNGLQAGNYVRYSGVNVGTVSDIDMVENGKIRVEMSIAAETGRFIKKNAVASVASDGLVGSMVLNIVPGKEESAKAVVSGDTIQVRVRIGTDEMLATLSKTNKNAALLTEDLLKITHKILVGKGTLGIMLSDTLMAKNIRQSVFEVEKTTAGTSAAIGKINTIISKVDYDQSAASVLLSDKASAAQIKLVFANLEKSSNNINDLTKKMDDYFDKMKAGEGTLNYITQNKDLAKDIDSTMINIKQASEKLNENMEALKHNFLFRGYFRRQAQQKKKDSLKMINIKKN